MSYVSRSQNSFLYIGLSTADPLPAPGSDTMREVPLLGAIKPATRSLTKAFFNILNDALRRSVGGKSADKEWTGNFIVDDDEQVHNDIMDDADVAGGQKRNMRVVMPNGRQHDFVGFVSNYDEEELQASDTPEAWRANFTITQDGADTVTRP